MSATPERVLHIRPRFLFAAVIICIIFVHLSYIFNGFTWLDHGDIESGRAFTHAQNLETILTHRYAQTGFYRPAVTLFHSLDKALFNQWAPGYHLTNIILHVAAASSAVLFISSYLPLGILEKLIVMLIFGIHPLSWLPVGAISYRQEIMLVLFMYIAVWAYAKNRNEGKDYYGVVAVISTFFALLSKETAIVLLPLYMGIWELKNGFSQMKRLTLQTTAMWIGLLVAGMGYLYLRYRAVPEIWKLSYTPMNMWQGIAMRINVLGLRVIEVVSPLRPALSDAVEITQHLNVYGIFFLVLLCLCVYMGYKRWISRSLWAPIALCVISLLPAANLIPLPRFSSPHYGYVLIAPVLACVLFISSYKPVKTALMYIAVLWVMIAMYYTYISGFAFKNDLTLFGREVSRDSHFLEGHYYLGDYAWKHKDLSTAAFHYEMAYHPDPRYLAYVDRTSLLINYAGVLLEQGKPEKALPLLEEAHVQRADVDKALITYNLARAYYQKRNYQKVIELLSEDIQWSRSEPYIMLAMSYYHQKEYKNAVSTFRKALPFLGTEGKAKVIELIKKIIIGDRL